MINNMNIYLSGGGAKSLFQLRILNNIKKETSTNNITTGKILNKYNLNNIYGVSFGSVIGMYAINDKLDKLEKFVFDKKNRQIVKNFNLFGLRYYIRQIPLIGYYSNKALDVMWLIYSLCTGYMLEHSSFDKILNNIGKIDKEKSKKFYTLVYNISDNKSEFIRGDHPLIFDYIKASCSIWGIFKPMNVIRLSTECECDNSCDCDRQQNNIDFCSCSNMNHKYKQYIDFGLIQTYPLKEIIPDEHKDNYHSMYLMTNNMKKLKHAKIYQRGNLIEKLYEIISFLINQRNGDHYEASCKNKTMYISYTPPMDSPINLDEQTIKSIVNDGDKIYSQMMNEHKNDNNYHIEYMSSLIN